MKKPTYSQRVSLMNRRMISRHNRIIGYYFNAPEVITRVLSV